MKLSPTAPDFPLHLERLGKAAVLSLDTETTGLRPFHGDYPFAIVFATDGEQFYYELEGRDALACRPEHAPLRDWFRSSPRVFFLHNAKFDIHHLESIGVEFHPETKFFDTMVAARLAQSDMMSYSLAAAAKHFIGAEKDDRVAKYIDEHGLWDWQENEDLGYRVKRMYFDRVPRDLLQEYAEKDARVTYDLALHLLKLFRDQDAAAPDEWPKIEPLVASEMRLVRVCADMERRGVLINADYCREAMAYEKDRYEAAAAVFQAETGEDYKASSKLFERTLPYNKETHPRTERGNLSFDGKALANLTGAAAGAVLDCKDALSRVNFYAGFLYHGDAGGRIHTNLRQAGTKTGRFSSLEPNLQNMTRPEDGAESEAYPVRRAIVPTEGRAFVMLDYKAMEYRLMLDYAAEMPLIEQVQRGVDVHQATGDMVGISRQQGKTLNFALLYGAGKAKLATMLGVAEDEAQRLKNRYFSSLPRVRDFIYNVRRIAKSRGFIFNWYGRRVHYTESWMSYAAPNHLIQGGCADIAKQAMLRVADMLAATKSAMVLVVHDEIILDMHPDDFPLVSEIAEAMSSVYPHKHLPMGVSVSHSWKSLADKVSGPPQSR